MTETYDIVAVETDNPVNVGCTVAFERAYTLQEGFPITDDAAISAIEDAYQWFTSDKLLELEERSVIGQLTTEDGNYIETTIQRPQ